jgi:plasmid stability protein
MHFGGIAMGYLTVRSLPNDVSKALRSETRRSGKSLNQTVIDLLRQALGLSWDSPPANGLEKLAGTWSQEELHRFENATAVFERVDEGEWR